jgi:1-acyl-sn-glycerol-3-phosphate acyltransferase
MSRREEARCLPDYDSAIFLLPSLAGVIKFIKTTVLPVGYQILAASIFIITKNLGKPAGSGNNLLHLTPVENIRFEMTGSGETRMNTNSSNSMKDNRTRVPDDHRNKKLLEEKEKNLHVSVREVLRSKNPRLARVIPSFIVKYLERVIHEDEINLILERFGHLNDAEFISAFLNAMQIKYRVEGSENIPSSGRHIFASNHPLGGLDGLIFMNELSMHFSEIRFPVNDILMNIRNLSGFFIPINKHGGQARDAIRLLDETFASNCQILYFPAGLCSRKKRGVIKDLEWHKSFIAKAVQHHRDVIPVFFSGRNSDFFYNLANIRKRLGIKANIEMLYLPDEMFRQKGREISLVFGRRIPWQTFDKSKSLTGWAEWVKSRSYELESFITR